MRSFQASPEAASLLTQSNPSKVRGIQSLIINNAIEAYCPKIISGEVNILDAHKAKGNSDQSQQ